MTWASLTRDIEMQRDKAQCEASNENYDIAWAQDNEKVHSLLTTFMMWASLTRDVEMQRDKELWEVWAHDDEKLNSMLLKFMTLASLARGVEMQRGGYSCYSYDLFHCNLNARVEPCSLNKTLHNR
mmetsp:Transcript_8799/g.18951  ORF Transcript_8799/g.18951 Transcript_8799/m.18951 type:complete len:126 (+) Transcript_8799:674-1051(+)